METPEELGIEDTSSLTDADWAEINKLVRAYNSGARSRSKGHLADWSRATRFGARESTALFSHTDYAKR
jgi:hypothetical protein